MLIVVTKRVGPKEANFSFNLNSLGLENGLGELKSHYRLWDPQII
jgi:hypothetical protein